MVFYAGRLTNISVMSSAELPYRSLRFDFVEYEREHFQSNSVINYPETTILRVSANISTF